MTLFASALVCINQGREYLAGILVAFGLFKFQLVVPVFILFLAWRRWRFSVGFAWMAVMLAAVSVWIAGIEQSVDYLRSVVQISKSQGLSSGLPLPVDHMANLHGILSAILGRSSLLFPMTVMISAVIVIIMQLVGDPWVRMRC